MTSPLIDGATFGLWKPIFFVIYGTIYILKQLRHPKISIRNTPKKWACKIIFLKWDVLSPWSIFPVFSQRRYDGWIIQTWVFPKNIHWLNGLKYFPEHNVQSRLASWLFTIFVGSDKNCREVIAFPLSNFSLKEDILPQLTPGVENRVDLGVE